MFTYGSYNTLQQAFMIASLCPYELLAFAVLPQTPTGFQVNNSFSTPSTLTVTLVWDSNTGNSNYSITFSPPSLSQVPHIIETPPLNVTLNKSIVAYSASIVALNCNGESAAATLSIDSPTSDQRSEKN